MLLLVRKHFGALRPANEDAEEVIKKLKDGDYQIEIKRSRNLKWHRKYWLACTIVSENMREDEPVSKEAVSDYVKIETGHVNLVKIRGEIYRFPKSISFSSMAPEEWEVFWEKAVEVFCAKLIPGLDRDELELELFELLR